MTEISMRLIGAIIVGLLALPIIPASAGTAMSGTSANGAATDISSQVRIETGRHGIGVDVGRRHHRWESRREHRRHDRRRCRTVTVTRDTRHGRVTKTERRCH
jgi:hypothetical protein